MRDDRRHSINLSSVTGYREATDLYLGQCLYIEFSAHSRTAACNVYPLRGSASATGVAGHAFTSGSQYTIRTS